MELGSLNQDSDYKKKGGPLVKELVRKFCFPFL
jgi:hypothetical protein